jgi:hypothetical protein
MSVTRPSLTVSVTGSRQSPGGKWDVVSQTTVPFAVPGSGSAWISPKGQVPPPSLPVFASRSNGSLPQRLAK